MILSLILTIKLMMNPRLKKMSKKSKKGMKRWTGKKRRRKLRKRRRKKKKTIDWVLNPYPIFHHLFT